MKTLILALLFVLTLGACASVPAGKWSPNAQGLTDQNLLAAIDECNSFSFSGFNNYSFCMRQQGWHWVTQGSEE